MKCPKCPGELQAVQHDQIAAEGCSNCRGLLLKPQAVDEVMLFSMVETYLDIGLPEIGRAFDHIDDIQCPHCAVDMEKLDDPEQPHIWTERCPNCGRIFFDAGELTDLKYKTFSDIFWDFLKGRREAN